MDVNSSIMSDEDQSQVMLLCGRAVLGPAASGGFGGMCPPTARAGITRPRAAPRAGQHAEPEREGQRAGEGQDEDPA
jgi:hypothetical protein